MARQVLDHGVIIPAEYSDDWYEDMSTNLNKLNEVIGSDADKLSEADVSEVALSGDYDDLTNKPDLKPVATSGDYDDLTNKPNYGILRMTSETLSDSGSGAISNLNSDSKLAAGDYVLDAALKVFPITAVSAPNYTVGTALFQITNASALAAVATSGSYDDLNNLPTYGITRFVNAAISDNSNVAFANISSVDKIKAGDFLLDNTGKMYLIASIDSVNETAAVTTPLTQLAVDANVMHLSGNETASGEKTFNNVVPINGVYIGNEPSTTFRTVLLLRSRYDTAGKSGWLVSKFRSNSAQGQLSGSDTVVLSFDVLENEVRTNGILRFSLSSWSGNTPTRFSLIPNSAIESALGSAGNKWNTINGINPGSLSFPDLSNGLDISGYITAGNAHNEYTPIVDGWISVIIKKTTVSGALAIFLYQGDMCSSYFGNTSLPNDTEFCGMASIPVKAGSVVNIDLKGSNTYVYSAKFYPCLGNV